MKSYFVKCGVDCIIVSSIPFGYKEVILNQKKAFVAFGMGARFGIVQIDKPFLLALAPGDEVPFTISDVRVDGFEDLFIAS
ncbi:MAG: hypothetical protein WBP58_17720 [Chitinophagaceae bacterium]